MKQFAVLFASLTLALSISGCGGSAPAGARVEDMPDEVKEYEARREAERGKAPTAKAPSRAKIQGSAAAGEAGAR